MRELSLMFGNKFDKANTKKFFAQKDTNSILLKKILKHNFIGLAFLHST